jgi:predicted RNA-binding Zn ribbon-like protein
MKLWDNHVMRGVPALELVNADLGSTGDLGRWLAEAGDRAWGAKEEMALRLPDFARLRGTVRDLLDASMGGGSFPAAAVERLNEASSRVPRVLRLDPSSGVAVEEPVSGNPTATALAAVARSAIETLGGADRERLRRCPACGRYFLASRGDQRWCSAACGNRTRVARHYAKRLGSRTAIERREPVP